MVVITPLKVVIKVDRKIYNYRLNSKPFMEELNQATLSTIYLKSLNQLKIRLSLQVFSRKTVSVEVILLGNRVRTPKNLL